MPVGVSAWVWPSILPIGGEPSQQLSLVAIGPGGSGCLVQRLVLKFTQRLGLPTFERSIVRVAGEILCIALPGLSGGAFVALIHFASDEAFRLSPIGMMGLQLSATVRWGVNGLRKETHSLSPRSEARG